MADLVKVSGDIGALNLRHGADGCLPIDDNLISIFIFFVVVHPRDDLLCLLQVVHFLVLTIQVIHVHIGLRQKLLLLFDLLGLSVMHERLRNHRKRG